MNISRPNKIANKRYKFFTPFRVLYLIDKQTYKLDISKK